MVAPGVARAAQLRSLAVSVVMWRRMIGGSFAGGLVAAAAGAVVLSLVAGCSDDGGSEPETLFVFGGDVVAGDVVGLVADDADREVEWVDRRSGTVRSLSIDDADAEIQLIARLEVGADGEQQGLVGHVVVDGRRFVALTRPGTSELIVAEVVGDGSDGSEIREVFSVGEAGSGAIGGPLQVSDGDVLLFAVGRNTGWDRDSGVGGAILALDPDGGPDQGERIVSQAYTNPWAFTSIPGTGGIGEVWVWDNAAGPDPDDESVDDVERIGRADLLVDRQQMERSSFPARAPSAMLELPDGRLGVCGFLDNELRAYDPVETDDPQRPTLQRAGTIMPCSTGAAVFADGTIVTVATTPDGESLLVLAP